MVEGTLSTERRFSPLELVFRKESVDEVISLLSPERVIEKGKAAIPEELRAKAALDFSRAMQEYRQANFALGDFFLKEFMEGGYKRVNAHLLVYDTGKKTEELKGDIDITDRLPQFRTSTYGENVTEIARERRELRNLERYIPKSVLIEFRRKDPFNIDIPVLVIRTKSPSSTVLKICNHLFRLQRQYPDRSEEIRDVSGIRFVAETQNHCYGILDYFKNKKHSRFIVDDDSVKDYIEKPKKNGYQSIHLTLMDEKGMVHAVQIRTREMDKHANGNPQMKGEVAKYDMIRRLSAEQIPIYKSVLEELCRTFCPDFPSQMFEAQYLDNKAFERK